MDTRVFETEFEFLLVRSVYAKRSHLKTLYDLLNGPIVIRGVVTGATLEGQTHPPLLADEMLVSGGAVQCGLADQVAEVVVTFCLCVSARTRTGMTAPVFSENFWCPRTLKMEPISPEWLVIEM